MHMDNILQIIFGRNTARGICTLLLCTLTYYYFDNAARNQLSLCCHGNWFEEVPSPGTHGGKLHRAWFVRKKRCVSFYAGCRLHFLHRWKNFHGSSTSQQSKWLSVCSHKYHDVTSLPTNSIRTRLTFSKSLVVSTAVSTLGCLGLMFVDPCTKINGS